MFAVREEVDDLKERIAELLERIQLLEQENALLQKHVPAEVLSSLQLPAIAHSPQLVAGAPQRSPVVSMATTPVVVPVVPVASETSHSSAVVVTAGDSPAALVLDQSSAL